MTIPWQTRPAVIYKFMNVFSVQRERTVREWAVESLKVRQWPEFKVRHGSSGAALRQ